MRYLADKSFAYGVAIGRSTDFDLGFGRRSRGVRGIIGIMGLTSLSLVLSACGGGSSGGGGDVDNTPPALAEKAITIPEGAKSTVDVEFADSDVLLSPSEEAAISSKLEGSSVGGFYTGEGSLTDKIEFVFYKDGEEEQKFDIIKITSPTSGSKFRFVLRGSLEDIEGDLKVIIKGLVEDKAGNVLGEDSPAEASLAIKDEVAPRLTGDGQTLSVKDKVITVHFSEEVEILDESKITLTEDGVDKPLTDAEIAVSGKTITITFNDDLKSGSSYAVTIAEGGVTDKASTPNNSQGELVAEVDDKAPTLKETDGKTDALTIDQAAKTFTVSFNEKVKGTGDNGEFDKSKFTIEGLTVESVSIHPIDSSKIVLSVSGDLPEGSKYKVSIGEDAVEDIVGNKLLEVSTEEDVLDTTAPTLKETEGEKDALTIDSLSKTFTISFSEEVMAAGGEEAFDTSKFTIAGLTVESVVSDADDKTKVVVTVSDESIPDGTYKVAIATGAIADFFGNNLVAVETEEDLGGVAPVLKETDGKKDALVIDRLAKTFTISFNEDVKGTGADGAFDTSKFTIAGLTVSSVASHATDKTKVVVTVSNDPIPDGKYSVAIAADAVVDLVDKKLEADSTEEGVVDTTAPTLKEKAGDNLTIDQAAKTFTISFNEEVKGTEADGAFDKSKFTITGLIVKSVASHSSDKTKVVVTVSDESISDGEYGVIILSGAVVDLYGNVLNELISTETDRIDKTSPTLKATAGKTDALVIDSIAKTFTISFNENVRGTGTDGAFDTTKFTITGLTVESVASDANDKTKVIVKVSEAVSDGTYKVSIGEDAVEDIVGNKLLEVSTEEDVLDTTAPTLKTGGNALAIDKATRTFTISFSENVKGTGDNGAFDTSKFTITDLIVKSVASHSSDKTKVVVTVEALPDGEYSVAIAAGAIVDFGNNRFAPTSTEEDVLDTTAPELTAEDNLVINRLAKTFTISFNEKVKGTGANGAFDKNKFTIAGLTVSGVASHSSDKTKVVVTVSNNSIPDGTYSVAIAADAVEDYYDNRFVAVATGTDVVDTVDPTLKTGGNALAIDKATKVFTVSFSEEVKGTGANGAFDTRKFTINNLTVKSVASHSSDKTKIVVTVWNNPVPDREYKLAIEDNAVEDLEGNGLAAVSTEKDVLDTTAPTLEKGGNLSSSNKKLTLTFSENVRGTGANGAFDKNKFKIAGKTVSNVASHSSDETKVVVTVSDSSIPDGTYKVSIAADAVEDYYDNALAAVNNRDFPGGISPTLKTGGALSFVETSINRQFKMTVSFNENVKGTLANGAFDTSKFQVVSTVTIKSYSTNTFNFGSLTVTSDSNRSKVIVEGKGSVAGWAEGWHWRYDNDKTNKITIKVKLLEGAVIDNIGNPNTATETETDTKVGIGDHKSIEDDSDVIGLGYLSDADYGF